MENRDEINRTLHEFMGRCIYHPIQPKIGLDYNGNCSLCGEPKSRHIGWYEVYTSSDSPRRLLEEVVAKIDDSESLMSFVVQIIGWSTYDLKATAEQIATACYNVIKSSTASPTTETGEATHGPK